MMTRASRALASSSSQPAMSTIKGQLRDQNVDSRLPPSLDRRFEAVVFDWDGTAVPDRSADASELRALVEELSALGLDLIVVTGTHVGNVDGQLGARPTGPGRLYFCVNRGSEVYAASPDGPRARRGPAGDACGGGGARRGCSGYRRRACAPRCHRSGGFAAAEPAQDRPDPGAGVGRPAEGADR